jgi:site-specific DNA-methyltransferase (adenine-specific)
MGTGTTLVAAQREGARGIGIDLDPAYVAIAEARLAAEANQP